MLLEHKNYSQLPDLSGLNILSRTNSALNVIDLGLRQAKRPIVTTKFGPQSAVILHLITRIKPDIPVIWIDSGYNTKATHDFATEIIKTLNINLDVFRPATPWNGTVPDVHDPMREDFVEQIKLEPFNRALRKHKPDVWLTSLRREQTDHRDRMSVFQASSQNILKACPLLDWRNTDTDAYLTLHQLPNGHDFYDPTKAEPHLECGLHIRF